MKLIARIFALALVVTGAAATSQIAFASQPTVRAAVTAEPMPTCNPDGSQGDCGMSDPK